MRSALSFISAIFFTGIGILALPTLAFSQDTGAGLVVMAASNLPDAPQPQGTAGPPSEQTPADPSQSAQQPAPTPTPAQAPADKDAAEKSTREKADEQLKAEEHQRVLGVMATFNTTRNMDALPLTKTQKFQLFFKSETDPWPFGLAAFVAGLGMAEDSYPEWGQGVQGYARRFGAGYSDAFIGNFFGNAVLTSLFREDPRYYQKGSGKFVNFRYILSSLSTHCWGDSREWADGFRPGNHWR